MADKCVNTYSQKRDKKKCTNYKGICSLSLHRKVYAKCPEKKGREIDEPRFQDAQCGFCPGVSIMDQIFALHQVFEKLWKYAKEVYTCFVDLKKHMTVF